MYKFGYNVISVVFFPENYVLRSAYKLSPAPVSTPSVGYTLGSNPKPAVSASVFRKVSKSKFSRISGFSRALKSRLNVEGCQTSQSLSF